MSNLEYQQLLPNPYAYKGGVVKTVALDLPTFLFCHNDMLVDPSGSLKDRRETVSIT